MKRTIFCFLSCLVSVLSGNLPEYMKHVRCYMKKDLRACVTKNGNLAIPLVAKGEIFSVENRNNKLGDPDFHIPKMIPLEVPFIQLISTPSLAVNLTNVRIHGLDKMKIVDNKFNLDQNLFTVTLNSKNLTIEGDYAADGKIMVMPIRGHGRFRVLLKNGTYKSTSTTNVIEKNAEKYFHPIKSRLNYNLEKVEFKFDNLFDGNKELGDQVNTFLNENWDLLLDDFGPGIATTISSVILDIFQKFAAKVSIKNIFLD